MANGRSNTNEIGSAARTVFFISAVVMMSILIIVGIYLIQLQNDKEQPESSAYDIRKDFSDLIAESSESLPVYEEMEIPEMTIEEAFSLYKENSSYYHECTVTSVGTDGTTHERIKRILRDGENYNIRTYNKNTLIETIKCDGEYILIINETTGKSNRIPLTKDLSPMELASMPSHENLLALLNEYNSADSEDLPALSKCTYSMIRARDMNLLNLIVTYRDTGITERYFYYLNYGIIYHCSSEASGSNAQPYSMSTTYFNQNISDFINEDSFLTE